MSKKYYIKPSDLPPKLPLTGTIVWWMFLDYIKAPGWAFGVIGAFLLIVWVAELTNIGIKTSKGVFDD